MREIERFVVAFAVVAAIGCKDKTVVDDPPTPTPGPGSNAKATSAPPPPTWTLETAPVDVECGDAPLVVEKPEATKPAGDRALKHSPGIAVCHGLATVAAVCDCLASSVAKWAPDIMTAPAMCEVSKIDGFTDAHASLVEVSTNPPDDATKVGGRAFVLVAQQGSTWSAVDSVESQADVDLSVTPKRSGMVKMDRVDAKPGVGAMLYVIQSRSWTSEHALGEMDAEGSGQVTICSLPSASGAQPFCYVPLPLASWDFTHDDAEDKCQVRTGDLFAATISPTSVTLRLVHGKDPNTDTGRYGL